LHRIVGAWAGGGSRIAARIGGEEFAVLVEGMTDEAGAGLAKEIVERMHADPISAGGHAIALTVSVGMAQRRPGESADLVLRAADNACYRAKRLGRNQWRAADSVPERPLPVCEPAASGPIRLQLRRS
jgi:diguanylate cyclase (GGDEF)-like protein